MRKWIMVLALVILTLVPIPVVAQDQAHLSLMSVDIWPEYDQPSILYIYRITLAPGTVLPASLSLRIPSDAQINAVAVIDPSEGLINSPYDSTTQGKWTVLKITTNTLQVQIEYYRPLSKTGSARHILFEWPGDYTVDRLDVNFLRPFGADNVTLESHACKCQSRTGWINQLPCSGHQPCTKSTVFPDDRLHPPN